MGASGTKTALDWTFSHDGKGLESTPVGPFATLTLVRYRWWAIPASIFHMALFGRHLRRTQGLLFFKLLGSGKGGAFSLCPDLGQWGLWAVWERTQDAQSFFASSKIASTWGRISQEIWTVLLDPISSHGSWSGQRPFGECYESRRFDSEEAPIAILTRATIRLGKVASFWRAVGPVSRRMAQARDLIFSVGIGEAPLLRQATFSVWRSRAAMESFAYETPEHREVIRRVREERWYREDMFARFWVLSSTGTIHQKDPLAGSRALK